MQSKEEESSSSSGPLPTQLWVILSGEGFSDLEVLIADAWYPRAQVSRVHDAGDDLTQCTMLDLKLDKWLTDPSWEGIPGQDVWIRASFFWPAPRASDGRIDDPFVIDAMRMHRHDSAIRVRIEKPHSHSIDVRAYLRLVARLAEDARGIVLDPLSGKQWDAEAFRASHARLLDAPPILGKPSR